MIVKCVLKNLNSIWTGATVTNVHFKQQVFHQIDAQLANLAFSQETLQHIEFAIEKSIKTHAVRESLFSYFFTLLCKQSKQHVQHLQQQILVFEEIIFTFCRIFFGEDFWINGV